MKKIRAMDYFVFLIALAAIAASFILLKPQQSNVVVVTHENVEYAFSLDRDAIYEIPGTLGITELEIKDGKFRFISSPCNGKTCIYQGFSDFIVCLPNKVIASADKGDIDAVSR